LPCALLARFWARLIHVGFVAAYDAGNEVVGGHADVIVAVVGRVETVVLWRIVEAVVDVVVVVVVVVAVAVVIEPARLAHDLTVHFSMLQVLR
jgi:hypothetical protein